MKLSNQEPKTVDNADLDPGDQLLSVQLCVIVVSEVGAHGGAVLQVNLAALLKVEHFRGDAAEGANYTEEDNHRLNGDGRPDSLVLSFHCTKSVGVNEKTPN